MRRVLTIAGSDSGAGAGIQADLKTFAAFEVYGLSAITVITAQNTVGVRAIQPVAPDVVATQIEAVVTDIGVDAAKTGMLYSAEIIEAVARAVRELGIPNLVVDPVMVAKSHDRLLQDEAVSALRGVLLPLATVVTPNLPEAEVLVGRAIETDEDIRLAAREIASMGARNVVIKGGHRARDPVDVLYDGQQYWLFPGWRVTSGSAHGTGCTFSAAVAACLAKGLSVERAVAAAKHYVTEAMRHGLNLGRGCHLLNHFYLWSSREALAR